MCKGNVGGRWLVWQQL